MPAIFYLLARFGTEEEAKRGEERIEAILEAIINEQLEDAKLTELFKMKKDDLLCWSGYGYEEISAPFLHNTDVLMLNNANITRWYCPSLDNMADLFYKLGAVRVLWVPDDAIDVFEYLTLLADKEYEKKIARPKKLNERRLKREIDPLIVKRKLCEC